MQIGWIPLLQLDGARFVPYPHPAALEGNNLNAAKFITIYNHE